MVSKMSQIATVDKTFHFQRCRMLNYIEKQENKMNCFQFFVTSVLVEDLSG